MKKDRPPRAQELGGAKRQELYAIEWQKIIVSKDKDGPLFDKSAIEPPPRDLVDSVKEYGVLEPIVLRRAEVRGKVVFELVDGRKRLGAFAQAEAEFEKEGTPLPPHMNKGRIQFVLKRADDERAEDLMVILNEHRYDRTPEEKAEICVRLLKHGKTQVHISKLFRVSVDTIRNWTKSAEVAAKDPDVKRVVEKIGPTAGYKLASMPEAKRGEAAKRMLEAAAKHTEKKKDAAATKAAEANKKKAQKQSEKTKQVPLVKEPEKAPATKASKSTNEKRGMTAAVIRDLDAQRQKQGDKKPAANKSAKCPRTVGEMEALIEKHGDDLGTAAVAVARWALGDDGALRDFIDEKTDGETSATA